MLYLDILEVPMKSVLHNAHVWNKYNLNLGKFVLLHNISVVTQFIFYVLYTYICMKNL